MNRIVTKCAAVARAVGYEGVVEMSSGKLYATVDDDLIILARSNPPWEDFGYSFEAAGLDRIGAKPNAIK